MSSSAGVAGGVAAGSAGGADGAEHPATKLAHSTIAAAVLIMPMLAPFDSLVTV